MIDDWEEFKIGAGDDRGLLHVTLDKKGVILLGSQTYQQFNRPERVVLLFSRATNKIGVKRTDRHEPNSYPVKSKGPQYGYRFINANKFCRFYGIGTDRTIAFHDPQISAD